MIREAIREVVEGHDLSTQASREVMTEMMRGDATPSQIASFVTAMRMKGESCRELKGFVLAMREGSARVEAPPGAVDLCGTGGDGSGTFNISTAASFVVAAAGVPVAKHGNRSVSSLAGSADVLDALGIPYQLDSARVTRCMTEVGLGFMFAPFYHESMKNVSGPRKELGIRTFFNIIGPMTNPAAVTHQLIGVYDPKLAPVVAGVLNDLGTERAMVVNSGGLDEISTTDETNVVELRDGSMFEYSFGPGKFGLDAADPEELRGGDSFENARIMLSILKGERSARSDVVALNAAAALYVSGGARSIDDGLEIAQMTISNGKAMQKLREFATLTRALQTESEAAIDVSRMRGKRLMPGTLSHRAGELATDLTRRILEANGSAALEMLDPGLLSEPNTLSVIVLNRILSVLGERAQAVERCGRSKSSLSGSIAESNGIALIAEYKPTSPTAPPLQVPPSPETASEAYANPSVAGISVLMEPDFFRGGESLFTFFRQRSMKPMLFKDFVAVESQLDVADRIGADAVLLIAKILTSEAIDSLVNSSIRRKIEPLIEVHDEADLQKLSTCESYDHVKMIGVNSRDLRTLETRLSSINRIRMLIPEGKICIAESGIRAPSDIQLVQSFDGVLVGSAFMQADDPPEKVAEFATACRGVAR